MLGRSAATDSSSGFHVARTIDLFISPSFDQAQLKIVYDSAQIIRAASVPDSDKVTWADRSCACTNGPEPAHPADAMRHPLRHDNVGSRTRDVGVHHALLGRFLSSRQSTLWQGRANQRHPPPRQLICGHHPGLSASAPSATAC